MAKLNHKGIGADDLCAALQTFLKACREPAVLEPGEELIPLIDGAYALETRSGRVWLECWHRKRSFSRRILTMERVSPGTIDCTIHRFGGLPGKLSFLDVAKPQTAHRRIVGDRQNFAGIFRRMLHRQFPGWDITALSAAMDLRRSFSPVFPRARLAKGNRQMAAIACPDATNERTLLTFALLWFDHVEKRRGTAQMRTELCLFLPEGAGSLTAHRLRWLHVGELAPRIFRFNEHGSAGEVDGRDLGNLDTRVSSSYLGSELAPELRSVLRRVASIPDVAMCPELPGALSVRYRGTEFARVSQSGVVLGMADKQTLRSSDWHRLERFAQQMQNLSHAVPSAEEKWLEAVVRRNLSAIEPVLKPEPVHGQVITFAALDRDCVDLLAIAETGRLAVLELKASEDIHLPIQALDYWMRVRWHVGRGELAHLFPGAHVLSEPPMLRLIAPALSFHSTHAVILRYFSPEVDVERIGVNSDWSVNLKVVLRLRGADQPQAHGGNNGIGELSRNQKGHHEP